MFALVIKIAKSRTARKVAAIAARKVYENVEIAIVDRDVEIEAFGRTVRVREKANSVVERVREQRSSVPTMASLDVYDDGW